MVAPGPTPLRPPPPFRQHSGSGVPVHILKRILLLGSTGSIGTQTLDLVRREDSGCAIAGLAANRSWEAVREQVREFGPPFVAMSDPEAAERLRPHLPAGTTLFAGPEAVIELIAAAEFDVAMHGMVGAAGLAPSIAILERSKTLALANKESLVMAGDELMQLARDRGAEIVPVDSEHCAIFQCLRGERLDRVRYVHLTASGGPFRTTELDALRDATPEMALVHPTWDMGPRITVGSATLMNKALEIIELHHLFGLERERIRVTVHPQSIVHSMVEFIDGSVIAQMGPPDMRGPIHFALHHPDRATAPLTGFDTSLFRELTFEEPDLERFPTLELGFRCVEEGADSGAVLNASDEVTVAAFLDRRIRFDQIERINRAVLDERPGLGSARGIQQIMDAIFASDAHARDLAQDRIDAYAVR